MRKQTHPSPGRRGRWSSGAPPAALMILWLAGPPMLASLSPPSDVAPAVASVAPKARLASVAPKARLASTVERASPGGDIMPRFFIETIAVEGAGQASSGIVVSESLLEEGRGYNEAELREAVYRVNRLPFVVEAAFTLGKGSERGRYRLLITVEEVETFFFGADLIYRDFGGSLAAGPAIDDALTDSITAGARLFAGQGIVFAAVGDGEDLQAGYARYRLLGRPVLL